MPLNLPNHPALPECHGKQWAVADLDKLATLVALVLIGRGKHAEAILGGVQRNVVAFALDLKEQLRRQLHPTSDGAMYQRDGLLFEIISWIAVKMGASPDEVISAAHLKSTQQGLDTVKIRFDAAQRTVTRIVVHEQKCTDNPRDDFRDKVLPAFAEWRSHKRDNELTQAVTALVERFNLSDAEHTRLFDDVVQLHPLAFQAALTVKPGAFSQPRCVALFKDYSDVTPELDDRFGDTFPLADVRPWFADFAARVWDKIENGHV